MKKSLFIAISILGISAILGGCAGSGNKQTFDKNRDLTWMYGCWQGTRSTISLSQDGLYRQSYKAGDDIRLRLLGKDAFRFDSKDSYSINGDFICVNEVPLYFINDSTKTLSECSFRSIDKIASIGNDGDSWVQGYYHVPYFVPDSHGGWSRSKSPIIKITDKIEFSSELFDSAFSLKEDDVVNLSYKASPKSTIVGNCLRIENYDDKIFWINEEKREIEELNLRDSYALSELRKYDEDRIKAEDEALSTMDKSWMYGIWEGTETVYEDDVLYAFDVSPQEYTQIYYRNAFSKSYEIVGPYLVPSDALTDGEIDDSYFNRFDYYDDFDGYYFDFMIDPHNRKLIYHGIPMTKINRSRAQEVFLLTSKQYNEGFGFVSSDNTERYIFYPSNNMAVYCKMVGRQTAPWTLWKYQVSGDGIISQGKGKYVNDYHDAEELDLKLEQRGDGFFNLFFNKGGKEFHAVLFSPEDNYLDGLFKLVVGYFDGSEATNSGVIYADEVDQSTNDAAIQGRIQRETIQKMRELNSTSDPQERQRINKEIDQLHRQSNESTMENLKKNQ